MTYLMTFMSVSCGFRVKDCVAPEQFFKVLVLASMEGIPTINPLESAPQMVDLKTLNERTLSVTKVSISDLPIYMGWFWVSPILFEIIKHGSLEKVVEAHQAEEDSIFRTIIYSLIKERQ